MEGPPGCLPSPQDTDKCQNGTEEPEELENRIMPYINQGIPARDHQFFATPINSGEHRGTQETENSAPPYINQATSARDHPESASSSGFAGDHRFFKTPRNCDQKRTIFEREFRPDAPEKVENRVVRVLRCGFSVLTIGDLITQATAQGVEMQSAWAIHKQHFPGVCTPADRRFPIGLTGEACRRCGTPWGRH